MDLPLKKCLASKELTVAVHLAAVRSTGMGDYISNASTI